MLDELYTLISINTKNAYGRDLFCYKETGISFPKAQE